MARYLCLIFLLLSTLEAFAQEEPPSTGQTPESKKIVRVDVNLVQVDVVVTDSKGRPVTDLTANDFVVYQDGKQREITNFSLVRTRVEKPPSSGPERSQQAKRTAIPSPPAPTTKLRRDQIRRTIALVVDDLGLSFPCIVRTREALRKWVDTEMQPGDLVAVILTGSGMGSLQQFTADKRMLYAAIDRIRYNIAGRVGVSGFPAISDQPLGLTGYAADERNKMRTEGTIGAIQYALAGLKDVPGRKSLILFSENLRVFIGDMFDISMQNLIQRLIDEANRSSVVIHAIDPRGIVYLGPTAEDNLNGLSEAAVAKSLNDRTLDYMQSQDGMIQLAHYTGGLFEDSNFVDTSLTEAVNDGDVYYLIGYQPDAKTVAEMRENSRHFHSVRVRVKRKGLQVRSRSGFFGTTDVPAQPATRNERIEKALYSPFASGTLPVHLTALFSETEDKQPYINALLHFDTNRLAFADEDGWKTAVVNIIATTFDVNGEQTSLSNTAWAIKAQNETFKEMQQSGAVFLVRVPVKKAGPYQIRVVVSDTASDEMGSASQFIEIPNVKKGRLALSGIALAATADQPGTVEDQREGMVASSNVDGTAAVRNFKPGETIAWAYQIFNAKSGEKQQYRLQTYVRLFHDGKSVFTGDPKDVVLEVRKDSGRLFGSGQMELKKITPGDYALQVVVLDKLAKEKNRIAEQSIDFSIQ